jgi:hypothetical protein
VVRPEGVGRTVGIAEMLTAYDSFDRDSTTVRNRLGNVLLPPKYEEFVALVRRHRPSELLPVLGAISAAQSLNVYRPKSNDILYPWSIAAAARESIAWGNEYRDKPVTDLALAQIGAGYSEARDPFLVEHGEDGALMSLIVRTSFEQFPHQHSLFEDMARVLPLFDQRVEGLEIVTRQAWAELLGCSLEDFIRVGTLLSTGCWKNSGIFEPKWLDQDNFAEIVERIPKEQTLEVFARHFASSWGEARASARRGRRTNDDLRRYDFNSLEARPFVEMTGGRYLAPQSSYVSRKVSPNGLYYAAMEKWGEPFSRDSGLLYERYVGEQLRLLEGSGAKVLPEVEYEPGSLSCDYFVITNYFCFCVEVKAARVAMPGRLNVKGYWDDVKRDVGKGFTQIARSGTLIESSHMGMPKETLAKTIRGLVVTAEPHYLINSVPVRKLLGSPKYPTAVLSVGQLERLIEYGLGGNGPGVLTRITQPDSDTDLPNVDEAFKAIENTGTRARNPILEEGMQRGMWSFDVDDK